MSRRTTLRTKKVGQPKHDMYKSKYKYVRSISSLQISIGEYKSRSVIQIWVGINTFGDKVVTAVDGYEARMSTRRGSRESVLSASVAETAGSDTAPNARSTSTCMCMTGCVPIIRTPERTSEPQHRAIAPVL